MDITKTVLFTALFAGIADSYACNPKINPVNFSLGGTNLIINKVLDNDNVHQIAKDAQPNPSKYPIVYDGCSYNFGRKTNSFFIFRNDSSLDALDKRVFPTPQGDRTFLAIRNASYTSLPTGAKPPKVYMSFAVYDPKFEERKTIAVNPNTHYQIMADPVRTDSIGLVIDKIYLYIITDQNSIPGTYRINNIRIGQMYTKTYSALGIEVDQSPEVNINISPGLTFQIKQSTCALDSKNYTITLPPILSRKFSTINQREGMTSQNIQMSCPDEASGIKFNATLSDNGPQAQENNKGLLSNQIATAQGGSNVQVVVLNESGAGIPISVNDNTHVFQFGTLDSSKKINFPIKVGYQATTLPITPGDVKAVANINIDYD